MYVWLDLETTGLHPQTHRILEVAVVLTDDKFVPYWKNSWLIKHSQDDMIFNIFAAEMHGNNNLLKALLDKNQEKHTLDDVQNMLDSMLPPRTEKQAILCGNSIHFDRRFIRQHMKLIDEQLHYRMIDVSAIKLMMYAMGLPPIKGKNVHRALDDVNESLEEFRRYREITKQGLDSYLKEIQNG